MTQPRNVPRISNEEKQAVWAAWEAGTPIRVPVTVQTNSRVIVLDPELNPGGHTFRQMFDDPRVMFKMHLEHEYYRATCLNHYCDWPAGLPDQWNVGVAWQNVCEAAFFGCELDFKDGQIPDAKPFLTDNNKERIFEVDIAHPLDRGIFSKGLEFYEAMVEFADGFEFHERPVKVSRFVYTATDGPLTTAIALRGSEFLTDMIVDPDYAARLLALITDAAIKRVKAFRQYWDDDSIMGGLADDAIQMISTEMYVEQVLPHHKRFAAFLPEAKRMMHLCGDVQRHLPTIASELDIEVFDTGFPIDFGKLRTDLGPDIWIYGGVPVALLLNGTQQQVYDETCRILASGIMEGGRFLMREANNLPPGVPLDNLAAMYRATLERGRY